MIELALLQLKVTVPVYHQQQLDMVTLELREDFIINEMVRNSAKEEWERACQLSIFSELTTDTRAIDTP